MKKMILWTTVLFTPLLWTTSVHAIFGLPDVAALAQRVTIIANQGIQITHAVTGLSRMTEQFNKLKEQYDHLQQQALGEIGALTAPLSELAALPGTLVADGLAWRADFTNPTTTGLIDALDLFSTSGTPLTDYWRDRINAAPDVTEADVLAEYENLPASSPTAPPRTIAGSATTASSGRPSIRPSTRPRPQQPRPCNQRSTRTLSFEGKRTPPAPRSGRRRSPDSSRAAKCPPPCCNCKPTRRPRPQPSSSPPSNVGANARRRAWRPFAPRAPSMTAAWPASRRAATAASACCFTSTSTGARSHDHSAATPDGAWSASTRYPRRGRRRSPGGIRPRRASAGITRGRGAPPHPRGGPCPGRAPSLRCARPGAAADRPDRPHQHPARRPGTTSRGFSTR